MILKAAPVRAWCFYYLGTLPFMAGFLFFLQFMSQSPIAYRYVTWLSLGLALAFVWMKACQTAFTRCLLAVRLGEPQPTIGRGFWFRAIREHGMTQWWSAPVYLISLAVAIPFGWANGFCQANTIVLGMDAVNNPRREAFRLAVIHQKQNQLLTAVLLVFGFFVFLNIFSGALILPKLCKMLLGMDTVFSIAGMNLISASFLLICLCLTYLVVDPFIKVSYLLRVFYLRSLETGEDLIGQTHTFLSKTGKLAKAATLLMLIGMLRPWGFGAQTEPPAGVDSQQLSAEIERVMQRPEFAWRMPTDEARDGSPESFFAQIAHGITRMFQSIGETIDRIMDWLERRLQDKDHDGKARSAGFPIDGLVLVLVVLALLITVWLVFKSWRKQQPKALPDQAPVDTTPDLTREDVVASDLPEDQWLVLARGYLDEGDFRLAMRAYFLALLSMLENHALIKVSMAKSNSDYLGEVRRRAHAFPKLDRYFKENILLFERAWYGLYDVDRDTLNAFEENRERMGDCVQS